MKEKRRIVIHSIVVCLILLFVIIGGGLLIMHDPIWTLDDSTIIQNTVGSGRMMHVYDPPGYDLDAKSGRFFPLAYMHTNLVLLFTEGYISAKPLFVLNFVLWVGFVVLLFFLCYCVLRERVKSQAMAEWTSLLVVLVICQRVLYNFSCLWTTVCVDNFLSVLFCVLFFKYLNSEGKKKQLYAVSALLTLAYFSFCIEVNLVLPFVVGFGMLLARKKKDFLTITSFFVVMLFVVLYCTLILPHAESFYDSSHGSEETILSNAIKLMLLQKLLILMFIILAYRAFRIVVKKDVMDPFYDILFLSGVGYTLGCFVLRLNWGLYYTIPIVFALPAMLKLLGFGTLRKGVASGIVLLGIFSYHVVKYPKLCRSIYDGKTKAYCEMTRFNQVLEPENTVVWYEDGETPDCQYAKCHVSRSLKHLKKNDGFELSSVESESKGVVALMPQNTDITELEKRNDNLVFVVKDEFAGLVLYNIE